VAKRALIVGITDQADVLDRLSLIKAVEESEPAMDNRAAMSAPPFMR
jgi:hypothetical protein